jgi:hypothetical protein
MEHMRKTALAHMIMLFTLLTSACEGDAKDERQGGEQQANAASGVLEDGTPDPHPDSERAVSYIILPQFDEAGGYLIDGIMEVAVQSGGRLLKGFADAKGRLIAEPAYEETKYVLGTRTASSGFKEGLAPVKKDGKWGYINDRGETAIDFLYDDAELFSGGRAVVQSGGRYGLIDKRGEWVVGPEYDRIFLWNGYAVYQSVGKYGFMDADGRLFTEPAYDFVDIRADDEIDLPYAYVYDGDLVGVVRLAEGAPKVIVPPKYTKIYPFQDGLAHFVTVHRDEDGNMLDAVTFGYIDETGNEIAVWEREPYRVGALSEGKISMQDDAGKWGYVDLAKNVVIPYRYDDASSFHHDMAVVTLNGKRGAIDPSGNWVLEPLYDEIIPFDGYAVVRDNAGKYLVSLSDGSRLSGVYDDIGRGYDVLPVKSGDKIGFIRRDGTEVTPPVYDECYAFAFWDGYAAVRQGEEWFYIDAEGNRLGETAFDEVGLFEGEYAKVRKGGKWGVVDRKQHIVVPIRFEDVSVYAEGLILAKIDGKYGFILPES